MCSLHARICMLVLCMCAVEANPAQVRLVLFSPPKGLAPATRHYAWWKVRVLQHLAETHRAERESQPEPHRRARCAWALLLDADAFVRAPPAFDLLQHLFGLALTTQRFPPHAAQALAVPTPMHR